MTMREESEMRERRSGPPGVQVGRFTWRGQLALQRGGTQQGLMEGLWFSTNFQLSLSTWQPPTRNGIITSRPPVSQLSSEERSGRGLRMMAPHPEDISRWDVRYAWYEFWDVCRQWKEEAILTDACLEKQKAKPGNMAHSRLWEPQILCGEISQIKRRRSGGG